MEMQQALEAMMAQAAEDYAAFSKDFRDPEASLQEYKDSISFEVGRKYVKVVKEGSVWGFVVNVQDDKKFAYGDILKAASWSAPARNAARGNVFGEYRVNWTGPHYM